MLVQEGPKDEPPKMFKDNMGELLRSGEQADLTLRFSDGQMLHCHRAIIACRGRKFAHKIGDKNIVQIDEMSYLTCQQFLMYLYTGNLTSFPNPCLFAVAEKYKMKNMSRHLEEVCASFLSASYFSRILSLANDYKLDWLKQKTIGFSLQHGMIQAIVVTKDWKTLRGNEKKLVKEVLNANGRMDLFCQRARRRR